MLRMAASSSPRLLAGEQLHREALESLKSYPASERWSPPPPRRDYPHGSRPTSGAAFSPQDVAHFCREGYVVLRNFYTQAEVHALREGTQGVLTRLGAERLAEQKGGSADMFYGDLAFAPVDGPADSGNPHRVGYVNDLHLYESALMPSIAHARILNCLTELLGPDIDAWQVATVVKPPGLTWAGGGYGWHQDIADYGGSGDCDGTTTTYSYHGMTCFGNLCTITYLNDCSADKGATSIIPRTHRVRVPGQPAGELIRCPLFTSSSSAGVWNGPYRSVEGIDDIEAAAVTPTVAPGDVLMFDSWSVHRANINTDTTESKIGLINVYCRPDCLPRSGPRADGTGRLGLELVRGGLLVSPMRPEKGVQGSLSRGWGDADRRGAAKI